MDFRSYWLSMMFLQDNCQGSNKSIEHVPSAHLAQAYQQVRLLEYRLFQNDLSREMITTSALKNSIISDGEISAQLKFSKRKRLDCIFRSELLQASYILASSVVDAELRAYLMCTSFMPLKITGTLYFNYHNSLQFWITWSHYSNWYSYCFQLPSRSRLGS